jgi:hypothetical protein
MDRCETARHDDGHRRPTPRYASVRSFAIRICRIRGIGVSLDGACVLASRRYAGRQSVDRNLRVHSATHFSRGRTIMEDQRFDAFVKSVAHRTSRRRLLTGILGLGAGVAVAAAGADSTEAARRGFSGPAFPPLTPPRMCSETGTSCSSSEECCSACCVSGGGGPAACVDESICSWL